MHIGNSLVICRSLKCFVTYSAKIIATIIMLAINLIYRSPACAFIIAISCRISSCFVSISRLVPSKGFGFSILLELELLFPIPTISREKLILLLSIVGRLSIVVIDQAMIIIVKTRKKSFLKVFNELISLYFRNRWETLRIEPVASIAPCNPGAQIRITLPRFSI